MEKRTRGDLLWATAILALLFVLVLPDLPSIAGLNAAADPTASSTTALAESATAVFDEEQAAKALEDRTIQVYDDASPSVVNITNRSYVYYRFKGAVPEEGGRIGVRV